MPLEIAAQAVLDAHAAFPDNTLADPLSMPPVLVKAHQTLDRAVDAALPRRRKSRRPQRPQIATDADRVAFLFDRYQHLTSLLPTDKPKRPRRRSTGGTK